MLKSRLRYNAQKTIQEENPLDKLNIVVKSNNKGVLEQNMIHSSSKEKLAATVPTLQQNASKEQLICEANPVDQEMQDLD